MALIILEGVDRSGKSTVAEYYKEQGWEVVHQSAPPKEMTRDLYLESQMQLISEASLKKIVLDRSYYGELVWPQVYSRQSLLDEEGLEILRETEEIVGTTRFLMVDSDIEAHWQRCVAAKEPLTRAQFAKAYSLYKQMAHTYGFERRTLSSFPIPSESKEMPAVTNEKQQQESKPKLVKTAEQTKLEVANAINDILSKRILKQKGPIFDQLEDNIRNFLNTELGKIFNGNDKHPSLSPFSREEVELLKFFCLNLKEKESKLKDRK